MKVRDVMIQISDCALVSSEHSLQAAMIMLSAVRRRFRDAEFRPRFVLVHNGQYDVVGVLREGEIVRALAKRAAGEYISLAELSAAASRISAGQAMIPYSPEATVAADAPVREAVAKMMDGTMRHLLVKEGGTTVGILRLSEIFAMVSQKAFRTTID